MNKISVFLDSGAFSAHRSGAVIDLGRYIRFIKRHHKYITTYANLDVIPSSPRFAEEAAKESWRNYQRMRSEGLEPMPVYHYGERRYWLEKMVAEGTGYVGLGGVARMKGGMKKQWLDGCFDSLGRLSPVKVHGFGITDHRLMDRYPWASVDSTSWMMTGVHGSVLLIGPDGLMSVDCGRDVGMMPHNITQRLKGCTDVYQRTQLTTASLVSYEITRVWLPVPRSGLLATSWHKTTDFGLYFSVTQDGKFAVILADNGVTHILISYLGVKYEAILGSFGGSMESLASGQWGITKGRKMERKRLLETA